MILNKTNEQIKRLNKPVVPAIILLIIIVIGTVGYEILWQDMDSDFIDSLYMTLITITTVGYSEIYPLGTSGRVFTMIIAVLGIGSLFYILTALMENLVILQISNLRNRRKMKDLIEKMENHIIVVGYGRVGMLAVDELYKRKQKFIIIDEKASEFAEQHSQSDIVFIEGDATDDDILRKAGIERAGGIMITTPNSATNVFVVLSAKVLNPALFVVARSDRKGNDEKLRLAGADRVVNPYEIGGQRLANLMINTHLVDFIETSFISGDDSLSLEKFALPKECPWFGKTLRQINLRSQVGASILAVIRDEKPFLNPGGDFKLLEGDQLIAFGTREELKKLESLASSHSENTL